MSKSIATWLGVPVWLILHPSYFILRKVDASSPNRRIGPIVSARTAGITETGIEIDPIRRPCPLQSPVKPLRYEEAAESA